MTTILANFGQELVIGVQETDVFPKNRRPKPTFWLILKNSQIEKKWIFSLKGAKKRF